MKKCIIAVMMLAVSVIVSAEEVKPMENPTRKQELLTYYQQLLSQQTQLQSQLEAVSKEINVTEGRLREQDYIATQTPKAEQTPVIEQ